MKKLCIIPARGGSKRLPGKNIKKLKGIPLICHTIKKAYPFFDKIIITSDDNKILTVCESFIADEINSIEKELDNRTDNKSNLAEYIKKLNSIELSIRPEKLAIDTSKVIDTVLYYGIREKANFEQIWLCLPTCPLKSKKDIKGAIELFDNSKNIDSVISITDFDFPPSLGLRKSESNKIWSSDKTDPWESGNTRSQDHESIYRPNGAIYGSTINSLLKYKNYYLGNVLGYYMPRKRSIDIDTKTDFKIAKALL